MKKLVLELETKISNKLAEKILKQGLQQIDTAILTVENKKVYLKRARIEND